MKETVNNKKKIVLFALMILLAVALCLSIVYLGEAKKIQSATASYNEEVMHFNEKAEKYNKYVENTCVDNIEGMPQSIESLSVEDDSLSASYRVLFSTNNEEKILADAATVHETAEYVDGLVTIVEQITAPTGDWVSECLGTVNVITGTEPVTKDHDPDGLLGKEGSYTDCVYFTLQMINPSEVEGKTIVDKGTDAGGAVEVYSNLEDAKNRCKYLSEFDGTVLYSGSYALVGTMVIRTSYKLSNQEQLRLTEVITEALTAV